MRYLVTARLKPRGGEQLKRAIDDGFGEEPWACVDCNGTAHLDARLTSRGRSFLDTLE